MPQQIKDCSDMKRQVLILSLLVMAITALDAKVVLPSVFSDNMVLQQQTDVAIWGKAEPGKKVTISASWMRSKVMVHAGDDGKWSTTCKAAYCDFGYKWDEYNQRCVEDACKKKEEEEEDNSDELLVVWICLGIVGFIVLVSLIVVVIEVVIKITKRKREGYQVLA